MSNMKATGATSQIIGYHFTGDKLRNGDPIPAIGQWLKHDGKIIVCRSGLHASKHPFDALQYAPGNMLHKVILKGGLKSHGEPTDKYVGRHRKILASINAEPLLKAFARKCALEVVHLWECPRVVKQYLETGDEKIRAAARAAVRAAERAAAWASARAAAWAAARAAARAAAGDAAKAAAWDAAGDAAWDNHRKLFAKMVKEAFK